MADFDREFFGLDFPGFQATQKIHARNSRPELSVFLSNFTFLNPKFIRGDFLLTEETKNLCGQATYELSQSTFFDENPSPRIASPPLCNSRCFHFQLETSSQNPKFRLRTPFSSWKTS